MEVRQGRLETAVREDEQFPVIIADPPWVPRDLTWQFPEDPLPAIDGGVDGLDVARACLAVVADHLAPEQGAVLFVEDANGDVSRIYILRPEELEQLTRAR